MPDFSLKEVLARWSFSDFVSIQKGFSAWVFHPGMLFSSTDKWWGDFGMREYPHEGLDFCLFKDNGYRCDRVDSTTPVPAISNGQVRAIFKDYLGYAIIVAHDTIKKGKMGFLSIYAHTSPLVDLAVGDNVVQNEVIATIADVKNTKAKILPHLHLSFGWPTETLIYDPFEWNRLRDPKVIRLVDPLEIIKPVYEVTAKIDRFQMSQY